ncbi:MAG: hypothetical protein LBF74_01760 [Treponema sp.]|jgi:hypothetical protein|nr:hypothetical protein [Treponema sp.]
MEGGDKAADRFIGIAAEGDNVVLVGLSSYFLAASLTRMLPVRGIELMAVAVDGRKRVRAVLPAQSAWNKEVDKIRSEVYVAVLAKYLEEASEWLYTKEDIV